MTYRDDRDALLARLAAVEAENRRLRAELDELRRPPEPPAPPPVPAAPTLSFAIREPGAAERVVHLTHDIIKVGKLSSCHLPITDPKISRMHAVIEHTADGPVIIDLGSTEGTFVNGARVNKQVLAHGDLLQLGETLIRIGVPSAAR